MDIFIRRFKHLRKMKKANMLNPNDRLKIMVLEDNEFYNRIMTQRLENFTNELALYMGFRYDLESYAHPDDFLRNLKTDTDIAFIDYYLGGGMNGKDMIVKIRQFCDHCKIVIISQASNVRATLKDGTGETTEFIFKDQYAIPKSCFVVEDVARKRFHPRNTI